MTREQAKAMLPIIQAFAEGKTIQFRENVTNKWENIKHPSFDGFPSDYRIKPEPKYRPFKTQEECWNEMLKHQPFGWVINKATDDYATIGEINKYGDLTFTTNEEERFTAGFLFEKFKFADETPFGIKEE